MDEKLNQIPEVVFDEEKAFEEGFTQSDESLAPQEQEAQIQQAIKDNPSLTEEQVRRLFEQNNQLIYGKVNELSRALQDVKQIATQTPQFSPQNIQVTPESFSKLREEFGDEISAALAHDLSQIQMMQAQQGFNQAQIDEYVSSQIAQAQIQFETKLVAMAHPDWKETVTSNEFGEWMQKQPPHIQEMLDQSWDSEFLTTAIGAFKAQNSRKKEVTQQRNDRLAAAVTPNGTGVVGYDEEDDFESGFYSTLKRI